MAFLDTVIPSRRQARMEALAEQIACASVEAVCRRVQLRIGQMTPAEARGYVRARSARIAHQKATNVLAHRPAYFVARREELVSMAREEIVRRVMSRVRRDEVRVEARRKAA